jgi:phage repressor protein C with HTH and peptisase S24 domain
MSKPIRTPLSEEQLADARRLQDVYKKRVQESREKGESTLTQTEVGERCEWKSPQSTVSQYMNGKVALNLEALLKLSAALHFEPAEVSPTLAMGLQRPAHAPDEANTEQGYAFIPQYTAKAAAGAGHDNVFVEERASLAFKQDWLRAKHARPDNLMVIYVTGDSMCPTICDGDVILVDRSRVDPTHNKLFLLMSKADGLVVKRLMLIEDMWVIRSDSQDKAQYPDRYLPQGERFELDIQGQVLWRGGDL